MSLMSLCFVVASYRRSFRSKYIKAKYRQSLFHEDNHKRLDPVFASEEYDDSDEEKGTEQNGSSGKSDRRTGRRSTVGMVEYTGTLTSILYRTYFS